MQLKGQDIVVLVRLLAYGHESWTFPQLASDLGVSTSVGYESVKRLQKARLLDFHSNPPKPVRVNSLEFLIHGVKYAFPAMLGGLTRGVPTAHGAPPLSSEIMESSDPPPVWPSPDGEARGLELEPLHKSAITGSRNDQNVYELLALIDAIRTGRARERELATRVLKERLLPNSDGRQVPRYS
jgi:hypothetical protein